MLYIWVMKGKGLIQLSVTLQVLFRFMGDDCSYKKRHNLLMRRISDTAGPQQTIMNRQAVWVTNCWLNLANVSIVGKTMINHPPVITINRCYKPFPNGLFIIVLPLLLFIIIYIYLFPEWWELTCIHLRCRGLSTSILCILQGPNCQLLAELSHGEFRYIYPFRF